MGHQYNTISNEEHKRRFEELFNNYQYTPENLKEMFFLYNDKLTPRKQDTGCGQCVAYVWKRLKEHYNGR